MKRTSAFPGLAVAAALLAALVLAGCSGGQGDSAAADTTAAEDTTQAAEAKEKAISVNQSPVRTGDLVQAVYADGAIRTPRAVEIRVKVGGEVTDVRVQDGDRVRKGQLLARIDRREYALALEDARYRHMQALSQIAAENDDVANDSEALASFEELRRDLDKLRGRGEITAAEHADRLLALELSALKQGAFRSDVLAQRTGLAEARVAEERAQLNLEHTEIRAPCGGVVTGLAVRAGEMASVNQAVCSIYDNEHLEAVVNVLEADLADLTEGRPVLLAIPAVDDTLRSTVQVISPRLDEQSRTCEIILRFDNPDGRYRPGMFVRAEIAARIFPDRLMVPRDAVLVRDDRTLLFKVTEDLRAQWLYVDTGLENDEWIEILKVHSGGSLAPGEQVVVSDHLTLAHEAKLKIRKTLPSRDRWIDGAEATGAL